VTAGSSGRLGRAAVLHLAAHGCDVVQADRAPVPGTAPEDFIRATRFDRSGRPGALVTV
jgi:NAD(P)-dependent dehydrogenase (short-subunit alcohol dehydrogenase family)